MTVFILTSATVLAHGGHGDEFKGEENATSTSIKVDPETAKRLGLKIEAFNKQKLGVRLTTTGQIEILPSKKVQLTAPLPGRIIKLLVEPNEVVKAGQPVAILASGELLTLRVEAAQKKAEALASLKQAQADLELAQENLSRGQKIAAAQITQTQTEVKIAQEQYDRDKDLAEQGALPQRTLLESQAHLAVGKAELTKALNQPEVNKAENEIKRAQASIEAAKTRLQLSEVTYKTRLQQISTIADSKGLVVVRAPIAGKVADREASIGQAFQDTGGKLMTIVNDDRVLVTANIYEKDLAQVKLGQKVKVKVASLPNQTFTGKISQIGSTVEGDKRVVLVKAELDNSTGQLKSGLFAQLEVITNKASADILAIPSTAIVEANGKKLVYLQNGDALTPTEVELGKTYGDLVEVKTGLFAGDLIVTQRAPQLYAQSLRGGTKPQVEKKVAPPEVPKSGVSFWLLGAAVTTFTAITLMVSLSKKKSTTPNL